MYPTIMAIHNISPETVLCRCCDRNVPRKPRPASGGIGGVKGHNMKRDCLAGKPRPVAGELHNHRVPEAGYTICEKREGIVPKTLRPILERRAWLKRKVKEMESEIEKFGVLSSPACTKPASRSLAEGRRFGEGRGAGGGEGVQGETNG
jgi:DNA polymerase-2